jgi:MYXO-CTERM domain-containing protein
MAFRSRRWVLGTAFSLWCCSTAIDAWACAGPCNVPDVIDAEYVGDDLFVLTNFGVLKKQEDGWHLDCEEVFGGTVTQAAFTEQATLVSTSVGLFRDGGEQCAWESNVEGASNSWFLDFSTFEARGDAGVARMIVALDIDRDTSEPKIELAEVGGPFHTVATFDSTFALRRVLTGGDPVRIFAAGYTFMPTTWHVVSAEAGAADFEDRAFAVGDSTGELLLAADPARNERLWIRAAESNGDPDAIQVLDPTDEAPREVFRLGKNEQLADIAFEDNRVFAAARGDGVSKIYVADSNDLAFEELTTFNGAFTCLTTTSKTWLGCNSDFTHNSEWIVASSDDEGESWTPELTLDELVDISSCGHVCATTTEWLDGLYGPAVDMPTTTGERDSGAEPAMAADASADAEQPTSEPPAKSGCGCRTSGKSGENTHWWPILLLGLVGLRRKLYGPPPR